MPWSVVAYFNTLGEAASARSALAAAGVDARVANENMIAVDWLYANAVGGVRLLVQDEDREVAEAVLAAPPSLPSEFDEEATVAEIEEPVPDEVLRCPDCGSQDVKRVPRGMIFIALSVLVGGVAFAVSQPEMAMIGIVVAGLLTAFTPTHRCASCSERWSPDLAEETTDDAPGPGPEPHELVEDRCPRCGSADFYNIHYRRLKAIPLMFSATVIAIVPIWFFLPKKRCQNCGLRTWL